MATTIIILGEKSKSHPSYVRGETVDSVPKLVVVLVPSIPPIEQPQTAS